MTFARRHGSWRIGSILASVVLAAGCAVGPRPTLIATPAVEDPAISRVLDLLAAAPDGSFQAEYLITVNYGGRTLTATVANEPGRTSVTIGSIRFLSDDSGQRTCDLETGSCERGLDDTKTSDVQVTHQFWSRAMMNRLRTDSERNIAPARASDMVIAGSDAMCAVVPVTGGDKSYCASLSGPLALYGGPDLSIELSELRDEVDDSLFGVGGA
ncbi:MAG: hypothetical protein O2925_03780 [Actinomycetota bacterium]|jgi:hypothetical protein|nr:hypothetical protein [Actinomycetota bacterium]MDA3015855.1 hypothetical protein [Actinomycetota bacterium]MDA3027897.1 hypothetical protein [Actinomycetota bacterium]